MREADLSQLQSVWLSRDLLNGNGENENENPELCCWWDRHTFKTESINLPHSYDEKRNKVYVYGYFCGVGCALAYEADNHAKQPNIQSRGLATWYFSKVFGLKMTDLRIRRAPSWKLLKEYGGTMDIDQFREMRCNPGPIGHRDLGIARIKLIPQIELASYDGIRRVVQLKQPRRRARAHQPIIAKTGLGELLG